jgi:hypothetical protein
MTRGENGHHQAWVRPLVKLHRDGKHSRGSRVSRTAPQGETCHRGMAAGTWARLRAAVARWIRRPLRRVAVVSWAPRQSGAWWSASSTHLAQSDGASSYPPYSLVFFHSLLWPWVFPSITFPSIQDSPRAIDRNCHHRGRGRSRHILTSLMMSTQASHWVSGPRKRMRLIFLDLSSSSSTPRIWA